MKHVVYRIVSLKYAEQPSHVLLQDDGLELWRSALRFTAEPTGDLIALAPLSVQLLSQGSDILRKVLRLIQSYIVLQPDYLTVSTFASLAQRGKLTFCCRSNRSQSS